MYYKLQNLEQNRHRLQNERNFLQEYEDKKLQVNLELLHVPKCNSLKRSKSIDDPMKSNHCVLQSSKRRRQSDSCLVRENINDKEIIKTLPCIEYKGIVKYLILFDEIAYACEELL